MDLDETFLLSVVGVIALLVLSLSYLDKRQERMMAEKGYCYQSVDRPGAQPSFQYQTCK